MHKIAWVFFYENCVEIATIFMLKLVNLIVLFFQWNLMKKNTKDWISVLSDRKFHQPSINQLCQSVSVGKIKLCAKTRG